MRSSIQHSGAVNGDPRYTFRLVEIEHGRVAVDSGIASVTFQMKDDELRDLILRARFALEDCRLRGLFDDGKLSFDEYEEAKGALDRNGPPNESNADG